MYLMKNLFLFVLLSGLATAAAVPLRSFIRAVPSAVGRKLFAFFIKINEWQNSVIIRNETSYNFLNFLKGNLLSKAFCCSSTAALFIADSYRRVHDELRKEPQTYWTPFSRCEVQQLAGTRCWPGSGSSRPPMWPALRNDARSVIHTIRTNTLN